MCTILHIFAQLTARYVHDYAEMYAGTNCTSSGKVLTNRMSLSINRMIHSSCFIYISLLLHAFYKPKNILDDSGKITRYANFKSISLTILLAYLIANVGYHHFSWRRHVHEAATKPGGGMGQYPQVNDLVRPCTHITLNLDHLVSCYYLFYVKDYRVKLSNDVCKGHSPAFLGM